MNTFPISYLTSGEVGRVEQLVGNIEDVRRLEEMGIRRGEQVQMVQPGSPCIVRLGGSRLCFREADGLGVMVAAESSAPAFATVATVAAVAS